MYGQVNPTERLSQKQQRRVQQREGSLDMRATDKLPGLLVLFSGDFVEIRSPARATAGS